MTYHIITQLVTPNGTPFLIATDPDNIKKWPEESKVCVWKITTKPGLLIEKPLVFIDFKNTKNEIDIFNHISMRGLDVKSPT